MNFDVIISSLTFIVLCIYAYYTYLIARENIIPVSSITLKQNIGSNINFYLRNYSKVETESFVKILANTEKGVFEFNEGPYGDKSPWISEPFTELNGHFKLQEMINKKNEKLEKYTKLGKIK